MVDLGDAFIFSSSVFLTFQSHPLWVKWTFREIFHSTKITLTTFLSDASEMWNLAPNEVLAQSKCHLKLTHFISWNLITPDPPHADSEVTRFLEIQYISIHELWILIQTVTLVYSCLFFICLPWLQCAWRDCHAKQPTAKTLFKGMGVCLCECVESSSFGSGCECLTSKM